ncbi:Protein kinase superfamily protein [Trifolium repens]|nr:Protein kinase superfamily protein [Trifolium repens]
MLERIRAKLTSERKEVILNLTETPDQFNFGIEPLAKDKNTKSASRFVADFRVRDEIGYGCVFLYTHFIDGKDYAVKRIPLELDFEEELREAKTLASLQHQHAVLYHQSWIDNGPIDYESSSGGGSGSTVSSMREIIGHLYIQMEYCPRTLRGLLDSSDISIDRQDLFQQVVNGVAFIHANGIVHRDLNPNNIFLNRANIIKIGDFGLGRIFTEGKYPNRAKVEFSVYRAPEMDAMHCEKIDIKYPIVDFHCSPATKIGYAQI